MSFEVNREELAWAAGLFEGEGSFCNTNNYKGVSGFLSQIGTFTDLDVLKRFHKVVGGIGYIYGPYERKTKDGRPQKTCWTWRAMSFEQVQAIVALLWPWLGERRKLQAKISLAAFHARPIMGFVSRKAQAAKRPEIKRLWAEGMRTNAIAKVLQVSPAFVSLVVTNDF
jgi:hypothetical protein